MKSRIKNLISKTGVVALTVASVLEIYNPVQLMAAGIKGTVSAISSLDVTVPVQALSFTIDNQGNFIADNNKKIINNSVIPIYAYLTDAYTEQDDVPIIVRTDSVDDWASLSHEDTISKIALKLNNKEIADVYHYAPEPSFEPEKYLALGVISADNGELPLTLEGSNGKDWRNATDLSFTYSVDMMFTSVENYFSDSTGSVLTVSESYNSGHGSYDSAITSNGYTAMALTTDFTLENDGTEANTQIGINTLGYKVEGDNAYFFIGFDAGYSTKTWSYSNKNGASLTEYAYSGLIIDREAGAGNEITVEVSKENIQNIINNGDGLNIRMVSYPGSINNGKQIINIPVEKLQAIIQ